VSLADQQMPIIDVGLSEKVSRVIAHEIASARMPEGNALPREQEMAQQYGVGRASVREALRLLELQGVVRIRAGKGGGPEVGHPDGGDLAETMTVALQMQGTSFGAMSEVVIALSGTEAAMAAGRRAARRRKRGPLDEALAPLPEGIPDDEFLLSSRRFHHELQAIAGNNVLTYLLDALDHLYTGRALALRKYHWTREDMLDIHSDHAQIAAAIRGGDSDEARQAAEAHMRRQTENAVRVNPKLLREMIDW
jgi:DNA-binding FadR family transcriptional regulator